jgi:hypothetical protein
MTWTNALGWAGSALLVFSLMQARVLRFRVLNLVACVILIVFNLILEIWPMVAMNVVLSAINVWFIAMLLREQHDEAAFEVLAVGFDDAYLGHVLRVHAEDIASHQPDFSAPAANAHSYLVQRADETVGVVVLHVEGTTASVDLDYVTPRYRDFTPGEFVWRQSRLLRDLGVARIRTSSEMVDAYYDRLGFTLVDGAYELTLA